MEPAAHWPQFPAPFMAEFASQAGGPGVCGRHFQAERALFNFWNSGPPGRATRPRCWNAGRGWGRGKQGLVQGCRGCSSCKFVILRKSARFKVTMHDAPKASAVRACRKSWKLLPRIPSRVAANAAASRIWGPDKSRKASRENTRWASLAASGGERFRLANWPSGARYTKPWPV